MGCCCDRRCGLIFGAVFGALVALLGGILIPVGNNVIQGTVTKEAVIEPGTTAYDNWVSAGGTVYRQFWFFDVKNPLEVVGHGAKPVVIEKGPYTYRTRYLAKQNITAHPNNTISYTLPSGAIFDRSNSVGPEEDMVTSLNLAVAAGYSLVPVDNHSALELIIRLNKASLFQHRSVKELLWGYQDPMFRFNLGIFAGYNDTVDGPYNVFTGKDDISKVSLIDTFMGETEVNYWNDTYCNMINGTDASSFPPFLDKKKPLFFFSSDICRSVSARYVESLDLKGIEVFRYTLPEETLTSPLVNADNKCFCRASTSNKYCSMAGILDVSSCRGGTPVYISLPHFFHGSRDLTEAVVGLRPSEEQHVTFLDVEPTTGFTLRFAKRLQVNMMYGPSKVITVLKKVKDYTYFPIVWLNETASLDDETADMFKKELIGRIQMLELLQKSLMGVGSCLFVVCLVAYCVSRREGCCGSSKTV